MRAALPRLLLVLLLLALIQGVQLLRGEVGAPVALAAGGLLLAGLYGGKVAAAVGLPRLTGYLLIGVVVGPYALSFIPAQGVKGLSLVSGLAVSLIALTAGTEMRLTLLQQVGRKVAALCTLVSLVTFVVSFGALVAVSPWVEFLREMTLGQRLAASSLIATVIVSFSPTVTIALVQETAARGRFTDFLMAMVIMGDLVVLVLFAFCAGLTRASMGGGFALWALVGEISWELFGSVLVGALLGVIVFVYMRRVGRELSIFLVGLAFAAAEGGVRLHLSPLLLCLAAGALISNLSPEDGARLHRAIQRAGLPVCALFFAAAGATLHLDALKVVGPLAVGLVALRAGALWWSCRRFVPREDAQLRQLLWMGLISQAGVTFGLASLMARSFPTFGPSAEVLIVAMVTLHELVGPVLTRRALVQSGEAHLGEGGTTAAH
ncbi:MAG: cation:proton antiporter [Myxococcaceae bacterium]|nr:cation:proton antiporter [Myxococcaceae bacterium]